MNLGNFLIPENNTKLAVIALIIANIIWGAAFPIYKWTLEVIPPFIFIFLRFFLGAIVLLPFILKDYKIRKEDLIMLLLLSFVGISLQIPLLFLGLQLSPSINAPIIISSGPIILIIASFLFLNEKIRRKVIAGTLISLFGVLLIILRPVLENGFSGSILGNLLFFLATICSVIQVLILKKISVFNNPIAITFWSFLIGCIPLSFFAFRELEVFDFSSIGMQGIFGIIYGVIFAAAIAHVFLTYAVKYIKASEIGIFTYVDPVVTILVAVPLLNEVITPSYALAALLVFSGIYIAEGRIHYHPFHLLKRSSLNKLSERID